MAPCWGCAMTATDTGSARQNAFQTLISRITEIVPVATGTAPGGTGATAGSGAMASAGVGGCVTVGAGAAVGAGAVGAAVVSVAGGG
jgi:hypothetical protein